MATSFTNLFQTRLSSSGSWQLLHTASGTTVIGSLIINNIAASTLTVSIAIASSTPGASDPRRIYELEVTKGNPYLLNSPWVIPDGDKMYALVDQTTDICADGMAEA